MNYKLKFLLCLLIILPGGFFAQNSHEQGQRDSAEIKLLNDKAWELIYTDKNACLVYALKALELAEKSGHAYSLSDTYNTLGVYHMITSDFKKSVLYHEKALAIRKKARDRKGEMKTYNNLGSAHKYLGEHRKEMDYYYMGLKLAEELKDTVVQMTLLNNIGDVFERLGNYSKAIECHNKVLSVREKSRDYKGLASTYINLAVMHYKIKKYDQSENYFARAENLLGTFKDMYITALFHSNYAALLKDTKRIEEALTHINASIKLHNEIGNTNGNLINYINYASILEDKNEFEKANAAYRSALEASKEVGSLQWQKQASYGLATTYESLGNYKEAFIHQANYYKLKDSLSNSEIKTRLEELEQKYRSEKLESENKLLSRANTINQLESERKGLIITSLSIAILVVACLLFFLWRHYRFRQQVKLLEATRLAEENERQRIAKDIHDEFGSGLTKIRFLSELLNNKPTEQTATLSSIAETSNSLVENMRDLIWVMNPDNATLDNLVARIREYSGQYLEDFNIKLTFNVPDTILSKRISKEVNRNIFMAVKEALQNIVKHSNATSTEIKITSGEILEVEIRDNGKGISSEVKSGNGLFNMRSRIEQLGGSFRIIQLEQGTSISFSIPV